MEISWHFTEKDFFRDLHEESLSFILGPAFLEEEPIHLPGGVRG
jgi:hypothetical protein